MDEYDFSGTSGCLPLVRLAKKSLGWACVELPDEVRKVMREVGSEIDKDDLTGDGKETHQHITVKYGLTGDDPDDVKIAVRGNRGGRVRMGKTSLFVKDDCEVLKVSVTGHALHSLWKALSELDNEDTFKEYVPHATIAYLKLGTGKKYKGIDSLEGMEFTFDSFVFEDADDNKTTIKLDGKVPEAKMEKNASSQVEHLHSRATDNHGNKFYATLIWDQNPIEGIPDRGPTLTLQEESGKTYGKWSWYLSSISERPSDSMFLDFGQGWKVSGMDAIREEANRIVQDRKTKSATLTDDDQDEYELPPSGEVFDHLAKSNRNVKTAQYDEDDFAIRMQEEMDEEEAAEPVATSKSTETSNRGISLDNLVVGDPYEINFMNTPSETGRLTGLSRAGHPNFELPGGTDLTVNPADISSIRSLLTFAVQKRTGPDGRWEYLTTLDEEGEESVDLYATRAEANSRKSDEVSRGTPQTDVRVFTLQNRTTVPAANRPAEEQPRNDPSRRWTIQVNVNDIWRDVINGDRVTTYVSEREASDAIARMISLNPDAHRTSDYRITPVLSREEGHQPAIPSENQPSLDLKWTYSVESVPMAMGNLSTVTFQRISATDRNRIQDAELYSALQEIGGSRMRGTGSNNKRIMTESQMARLAADPRFENVDNRYFAEYNTASHSNGEGWDRGSQSYGTPEEALAGLAVEMANFPKSGIRAGARISRVVDGRGVEAPVQWGQPFLVVRQEDESPNGEIRFGTPPPELAYRPFGSASAAVMAVRGYCGGHPDVREGEFSIVNTSSGSTIGITPPSASGQDGNRYIIEWMYIDRTLGPAVWMEWGRYATEQQARTAYRDFPRVDRQGIRNSISRIKELSSGSIIASDESTIDRRSESEGVKKQAQFEDDFEIRMQEEMAEEEAQAAEPPRFFIEQRYRGEWKKGGPLAWRSGFDSAESARQEMRRFLGIHEGEADQEDCRVVDSYRNPVQNEEQTSARTTGTQSSEPEPNVTSGMAPHPRGGRYVDFSFDDQGNLVMTPTTAGVAEAVDLDGNESESAFRDMIEDHLSNGWDLVNPEDTGAMTSALIITNDLRMNDQGDVLGVGDCWSNIDHYAITGEISEFAADRPVTWRKIQSSSENSNSSEATDPSGAVWIIEENVGSHASPEWFEEIFMNRGETRKFPTREAAQAFLDEYVTHEHAIAVSSGRPPPDADRYRIVGCSEENLSHPATNESRGKFRIEYRGENPTWLIWEYHSDLDPARFRSVMFPPADVPMHVRIVRESDNAVVDETVIQPNPPPRNRRRARSEELKKQAQFEDDFEIRMQEEMEEEEEQASAKNPVAPASSNHGTTNATSEGPFIGLYVLLIRSANGQVSDYHSSNGRPFEDPDQAWGAASNLVRTTGITRSSISVTDANGRVLPRPPIWGLAPGESYTPPFRIQHQHTPDRTWRSIQSPYPTLEEAVNEVIAWADRNGVLRNGTRVIDSHGHPVEIGPPTSLSPEGYLEINPNVESFTEDRPYFVQRLRLGSWINATTTEFANSRDAWDAAARMTLDFNESSLRVVDRNGVPLPRPRTFALPVAVAESFNRRSESEGVKKQAQFEDDFEIRMQEEMAEEEANMATDSYPTMQEAIEPEADPQIAWLVQEYVDSAAGRQSLDHARTMILLPLGESSSRQEVINYLLNSQAGIKRFYRNRFPLESESSWEAIKDEVGTELYRRVPGMRIGVIPLSGNPVPRQPLNEVRNITAAIDLQVGKSYDVNLFHDSQSGILVSPRSSDDNDMSNFMTIECTRPDGSVYNSNIPWRSITSIVETPITGPENLVKGSSYSWTLLNGERGRGVFVSNGIGSLRYELTFRSINDPLAERGQFIIDFQDLRSMEMINTRTTFEADVLAREFLTSPDYGVARTIERVNAMDLSRMTAVTDLMAMADRWVEETKSRTTDNWMNSWQAVREDFKNIIRAHVGDYSN